MLQTNTTKSRAGEAGKQGPTRGAKLDTATRDAASDDSVKTSPTRPVYDTTAIVEFGLPAPVLASKAAW